MRAPRLFTDQPLATGMEITLEPGASRHIVTVLRLTPGGSITLFNGEGGEYAATLHGGSGKQASVSVGRFSDMDRQSPLAIHLGIALSKGDRFDWVIQKATELGVAQITPLITARTEVRLSAERQQKKCQHWRQVAISACEQSGRNRLPCMIPPAPCRDWLSVQADVKLVLHPATANSPLLPRDLSPTSVALLVGPEGGFTDDEVSAALGLGFTPLRLGPRILRTETAPLAGISIVQAFWGDML